MEIIRGEVPEFMGDGSGMGCIPYGDGFGDGSGFGVGGYYLGGLGDGLGGGYGEPDGD